MEINFDSGVSIYLSFGEIWTIQIFLVALLIKPRNKRYLKRKHQNKSRSTGLEKYKMPGCEKFSQTL